MPVHEAQAFPFALSQKLQSFHPILEAPLRLSSPVNSARIVSSTPRRHAADISAGSASHLTPR